MEEEAAAAALDHFDRLPDALLLFVFDKLLDAKSLTRCLLVCKRFSSLVPQTNTLFLSIPPRMNDIPSSKINNALLLNPLKIFFIKFITKPLKHFRRICALKSTSLNRDSSSSLSSSYPFLKDVLRKFEEIKFMQIQFQVYGNGIGLEGCDFSLVKWKAEFGRELKSCIIVGATCLQRSDDLAMSEKNSCKELSELLEQDDEQFLTDDQLKLRIIWTISCLIAASARHHFLKQILSDHPILENVVISDGQKQGKVCMGQEELVEMRNSMNSMLVSSKSSMERTPLPDLSIKLAYVPKLELPTAGYTMKGATLIVIRPVDRVVRKESDGDLLGSGFDGDGEEKAFGEAVKEMMKMRKSYVMTMNSF